MIPRIRKVARPFAVVASVLAVMAGCGGSGTALPEVPDDAVSLTVNQPGRVGGLQVVASAIDDTGADLSGTDGTGVADGAWTQVGETVEIYGVTLRLVATWKDPDPPQGDGADTSKAWVVVEE